MVKNDFNCSNQATSSLDFELQLGNSWDRMDEDRREMEGDQWKEEWMTSKKEKTTERGKAPEKGQDFTRGSNISHDAQKF